MKEEINTEFRTKEIQIRLLEKSNREGWINYRVMRRQKKPNGWTEWRQMDTGLPDECMETFRQLIKPYLM